MRLVEGLLELIAPTRCAGCELPGALLCDECVRTLPRIDAADACPRCGAPFGRLVCTECWNDVLSFERGLAVGELDGALARAVVLHKDAGERRLGGVLGALMGEAVSHAWSDWPEVVTWIPPTAAAMRRRGFDHGRGLAEPAALRLGIPSEPLLTRARARDQRVLGRVERAANAAGTFSAVRRVAERVVIVDDVMTTGATLDAAAGALLGAGAPGVRVVVVARSW